MAARAGVESRTVLFRIAASGRIGFGHLMRATRLAAALSVVPRVSIRGTAAACATARRLGAEPVAGAPRELVRRGLRLLVIDDPSRRQALPWLRAARRAGVPVASFHDVGIAPLASDLAVDGSLGARRVRGLGLTAGACRLGAAFAVLSPQQATGRRARRAATIVVGLGGGQQAGAGLRIARHLRSGLDRIPALSRARVLLSLGFDRTALARAGALPAGVAVLTPERFRRALSTATLAVVAGGTTLYEACALGTPVVSVPVVPAQATTVRRFVRAGLAVGVPGPRLAVGTERWARAVAAAALALLIDRGRRARLAARGPRAIDGRGAARVADAVRRVLRGGDGRRARTR